MANKSRSRSQRRRSKFEATSTLRSVQEIFLFDPMTAFDVFGSEEPDDMFAGVLDQPRERGWREVNL